MGSLPTRTMRARRLQDRVSVTPSDHDGGEMQDGVAIMSKGPGPVVPVSWWCWLGAHGGSGVTTLSRLVPGGHDLHGSWPKNPGGPPVPVIVVARSDARGLRAAQDLARAWSDGETPGPVLLVGLVVVADAPGRLPKPLRDLERLVAGGYPRLWRVPWVEPWRQGVEGDEAIPALGLLASEVESLRGAGYRRSGEAVLLLATHEGPGC